MTIPGSVRIMNPSSADMPTAIHTPYWNDPSTVRRLARRKKYRQLKNTTKCTDNRPRSGLPRLYSPSTGPFPEQPPTGSAGLSEVILCQPPCACGTMTASAPEMPTCFETSQESLGSGHPFRQLTTQASAPVYSERTTISGSSIASSVEDPSTCPFLHNKPKEEADLILDFLGLSEDEYHAIMGHHGETLNEHGYQYRSPSRSMAPTTMEASIVDNILGEMRKYDERWW